MSRLNRYLNEGITDRVVKELKRLDPRKVKRELQDAWNKLKDIIEENGKEREFLRIINSNFGTSFSSLSQISKKKVQESQKIDEDFKHYWNWFKDQTWPALTIFPVLQIWFQIDSLLDGADISDLNFKKIIIYSLFWIILVTGKHIKMWYKWKKERPEEFEEEGEPGPFSI